jgi:sugar phosphate isomerase/epimerase
MKVGLYSITFLGIWYQGEGLTLEELIQRAKQYGYDGVELDGKRPHANPLDMRTSRCRELRRIADGECARYAADAGVTLALQNHEPVVTDHQDLLRMVREVDSPALKVSLDPWGLPVKTPEYIRQAARDVGPLQVLCHFGGVYERGPDGKVKGESHFRPFVAAMKEIGYQGYMSYELCGPPVGGQTLGIERAEKNAELATEFMRGLIEEQEG